ncbi:short chain fatty acids transporter [Geomicrobium sp. JCM 19037]|uniref:short-chain fatty acid transporter n=1 Tax=Geomicrobium sp. JCM 19037 TaxID=1460634 RepID=UPI00045F4C6C|nr:short-chain fatty acid transporter [Geomicrobium sp. JCM 19037]GAK02536.1 short chain fatty acids transporter [Geomicrobium sp. JCM 19037]
MFTHVTRFCDRIVQRYLPDAFLFALILTFIVFLLGIFITDSSPIAMVQFWGEGFWDLLEFAMQMSLIVVTGYILANSSVVKSILARLALFANTPGQAIMLVTLVATFACLINYGFGLVIGALFARHVVQQVPKVNFRLLVASAYSGMLVWHGGLSGSIPLTIATPGHFLEDMMGTIPIGETLFSPFNLFIVITMVILLPIMNRLLMRAADSSQKIEPVFTEQAAAKEETIDDKPKTAADRLENSQIISLVIGGLGLIFVVMHFVQNGLDLNLNIVNFTFLFLGILLHKTPRRFLKTVSDAVRNAGGIIIQFPFYAGIMGMMVESGLSDMMSEMFILISNEATFPLFTFISAAIVNFFVPSGGGQWAVQGPIMMSAAYEIGAEPARIAMAVAWGDAWTNMIQPFWTLPLLAIAGLKVRDIMGFCVIILIWSFIPIAIGLLFI